MTAAFVELANSLAEGHDVVELYISLTASCAAILDIASAGLLLADRHGTLQVAAASSEHTRNLELFLLQGVEGPSLDCYRTGVAVSVPDLAAAQDRWPDFAPVAVAAGFVSVHAVPMRLLQSTLGVLGLFGTRIAALSEEDLSLAQALADVASVALVSGRAAEDKTVLAQQLQAALDSRVVLEQAKGILAQGGGVEIEHAFAALRGYSRDHNLKLTAVAQAVVSRRLLPPQILGQVKIAAVRRGAKASRGLPGH
ncbi:MAG TPA: GAF and ANTAR domain-containing protein [Sporichthyaceae bacterium]|nr:GAF and ANTAR domain-containing protein [Sporichthyaceae bacterium]